MARKGAFKQLTLEERRLIEKYIKMGISFNQQARMIGRSNYTIADEIRRNGGRENYCAEKAQERAVVMRGRSSSNSQSKVYKGRIDKLETRVDSLEMQIEILMDLIKEIKQ